VEREADHSLLSSTENTKNAALRGLLKKYPTFGQEKYIYTPGGLQL